MNQEQARAAFEKDYTALKSYILGRGYYTALHALAFAREHHNGLRKDKVTPEFHHQVRMCFSIINLRGVRDEGMCIALACIHDLLEDKNISAPDLINERFDPELVGLATLMNKHVHTSEVLYFSAIAGDPHASVVKGVDNKDNIFSMVGVFTRPKIISYIERTKNEVLPMLKRSSQLFPDQTYAYGSISSNLKSVIKVYEGMSSLLPSVEQTSPVF